jgi:hypothetical protein
LARASLTVTLETRAPIGLKSRVKAARSPSAVAGETRPEIAAAAVSKSISAMLCSGHGVGRGRSPGAYSKSSSRSVPRPVTYCTTAFRLLERRIPLADIADLPDRKAAGLGEDVGSRKRPRICAPHVAIARQLAEQERNLQKGAAASGTR